MVIDNTGVVAIVRRDGCVVNVIHYSLPVTDVQRLHGILVHYMQWNLVPLQQYIRYFILITKVYFDTVLAG